MLSVQSILVLCLTAFHASLAAVLTVSAPTTQISSHSSTSGNLDNVGENKFPKDAQPIEVYHVEGGGPPPLHTCAEQNNNREMKASCNPAIGRRHRTEQAHHLP